MPKSSPKKRFEGDMHVVLKMDVVQHLMERLRPIVGLKSWDYCVLWKLSEDGRFIEWVGCCCGGSNHMNSGGDDQELAFPSFSYEIQCRDANFQHPRTKSCDLLAQLPSSLPSDSGIHAHTMISNQVRWLNLCNSSNSDHISEENIGTRVLIPVSVGLVELFVAKQVSEDQSAIDFVASQFNMSMQQQPDLLMAAQVNDQNDSHDHFQLPPVSPATMLEHLNLSSATISEYQTPFLQQFNYDEKANNYAMDLENGRSQEMDALQNNMNVVGRKKREGADKDGVNRSDSVSDCSDVNDEDDEPKNRRKNGKGPSKNLDAERKRRKKLNERLYALRALVPNISKLDRAAILVDAIDYVTELQKQVQDLQNQLVESSDDEGDANNRSTIIQDEVLHGNGPKSAHVTFSNGPHFEASTNGSIDISKQNQEVEKKCDKGQQMEPQVEVAQLDENEFFVKVFCEQKPGGFRKLMDGFNALGLEVTNVNVTSFRCLVSNVFRVEKRDSEMVEADHLKESLLELTRYPPRAWSEIIPKAHGKVDCGGVEHHHNHHFSDLHNHQPKSHFHRHLRN